MSDGDSEKPSSPAGKPPPASPPPSQVKPPSLQLLKKSGTPPGARPPGPPRGAWGAGRASTRVRGSQVSRMMSRLDTRASESLGRLVAVGVDDR